MTKTLNQRTFFRALVLICGLGLAACGPAATVPLDGELQGLAITTSLTTFSTLSSPNASTAQGTEAFETVMSVITDPRCINCHPSDNRPRQRDDQIVHILNVVRGDDNHGGPVQTCETCHHEENNPYSLVPGAPHWGLAPKSMGWLGLSNAEIAKTLLDPEKNGGRSHEDLIHHMSNDALVLWAWDPGADRTPPPVPHDEFVQALEEWLEDGAPIPGE